MTMSEHLQIQVLDNGIHELTWLSAARDGVDEWIRYSASLYQSHSPDDTLCFLHVVLHAQFPPMSYVMQQAWQLQRQYPQQPNTRSAIIFTSRFFGGFINTLSQLLNRKGKDLTRFFAEYERAEAMAWLLEDTKA